MNRLARVAVLAMAIATASTLSAARLVGFAGETFSQSIPETCEKSCVCSPFSFEVDCVLIAETLDTIRRANVAEALGVLTDFDGVYQPIFAEYAVRTNGFAFVCARGFCVPEPSEASSACRELLYQSYGAAVCQTFPHRGTDAWFRTAMDGEAEDFSVDITANEGGHYSFFDLVSVRFSWLNPFPTSNTRKLKFVDAKGVGCEMEFMTDVRNVDAWEGTNVKLLRLPLRNGADFYAMMPKDDAKLADIRNLFMEDKIDFLLTVLKSITERGVYHGPAVVALPKFDLTSQVNLLPIMSHFKIPTQGLNKIAGSATAGKIVQRVHLRVDEQGLDATPLREKPEAEVVRVTSDTRKYIFNRPFLFFVYHEATRSIPVAGQFTGLLEP